MRAFVCVGLTIILTIMLISVGLETGILDCNGQPCSGEKP